MQSSENLYLIVWINSRWKPQDGYELKLSSKGLFTTIFHDHKDREIIFETKAYFFHSVGLHLCYWMEKFNPKKEELSYALVWVRLYSLQ
jgi:hypothetical protein